MSKYAKIWKGAGWPLLVRFPDKRTREEQALRFGYEFPGGTFEEVDYPEARRGYDIGGGTAPCEMCNGETYPAHVPRGVIKAAKKARRQGRIIQ